MRVNADTKTRTRRALLDAAARAFAERGYHETPIDSVSEMAGVAKGTIYNYFSSKQELLHALVREACELAGQAAGATPSTASTQARLEAFVDANLTWARQRPALAVLFARELLAGDADTTAVIRRAAEPCVEKLAAILEEGIDRGEIDPHPQPEALALTFIALANMLLLQSWEAQPQWPSARQLPAAAAGLFLHGVATRGN
jgi:TetR/AcrR family transcriptional regulator, fatty acid metabolism regulator protein